jgi:hypothetical protein
MAINEEDAIDNTLTITTRTRGVITLSELSSLRLRKVTPFQYALLEVGHNVVINITPSGILEPGLLTSNQLKQLGVVIRPLSAKYVDRPYIFTSFDTIDELIRRDSFNIERLLDYMGNDKSIIRKIALSKDLSNKRPNYYIDEVDDKISLYLNKKLYSISPEKRPRINLLDYFQLIKILPNKIFHLLNIIGTKSSLILHRRSQRTSCFNSKSPLTRMERLFFWCATPLDGHYEFAFNEESFLKYIETDSFKKKFPLTNEQEILFQQCRKATEILSSALETEIGCILTEDEYDFLSTITVLQNNLIKQGDLYVFLNFHSEKLTHTKPDVQYWLNDLDRNRFKTYKPKGASITEVPMPGNSKQKAFFSKRFNQLKELNYSQIVKSYPDLIFISRTAPSHSIGRLSREGRRKVKKNLIELYKYYLYAQHKHNQAVDEPYWKKELSFLDNSLVINILLWQTNCLRTLVVT